jgi:hypothetical protein
MMEELFYLVNTTKRGLKESLIRFAGGGKDSLGYG